MIDGYTLDPVTGAGGAGIVLVNAAVVSTNNTVFFNKITASVPAGSFSSFVTQINIPFAGVLAQAQDGLLATNNHISITQGPAATGAAAAILVSDELSPTAVDLTSVNSVIVNNDGRGSNYSVVITLDLGGGTGNTVNTTLRGNFGVNSINTVTTGVTNRSIRTLVTCDAGGVCP